MASVREHYGEFASIEKFSFYQKNIDGTPRFCNEKYSDQYEKWFQINNTDNYMCEYCYNNSKLPKNILKSGRNTKNSMRCKIKKYN